MSASIERLYRFTAEMLKSWAVLASGQAGPMQHRPTSLPIAATTGVMALANARRADQQARFAGERAQRRATSAALIRKRVSRARERARDSTSIPPPAAQPADEWVSCLVVDGKRQGAQTGRCLPMANSGGRTRGAVDETGGALAVRPPVGSLVLPAIFYAADACSLAGQRRFLRAVKVRLVMLTLAAAAGGTSFVLDARGPDYVGILAAVAFIAALAAEVLILQTKPDQLWYEGRTAAESAKTLAWRYAVGGEPFGVNSVTGEAADRLFIQRIKDVLTGFGGLELSPILAHGQQITPTMRELREQTLDVRKAVYETDRVSDQQAWYAHKAAWNALWARRWSMVLITVEMLGGVGAVVNVAAELSGAAVALGMFGAAAAAIAAWMQTRDHQELIGAYSMAANELASIRALIDWQQTESSWAEFVRESEHAISREHSLWRASHGIQPTTPFWD
jgi:hypothetical protein